MGTGRTMVLGMVLMCGAAGISAAIVRRVMAIAANAGLLDHPNARSSHTTPTPRAGGLGIVVASLGGAGLVASMSGESTLLWPFLLGGACIAAVGLIDDVKGLSASFRLVAH